MCQSVYCSEEEVERERESKKWLNCKMWAQMQCNIKEPHTLLLRFFFYYFQLCSAFYANYSWKFHTQNYHFRLRLQCHLFPSTRFIYTWRERCVSLNEKCIAAVCVTSYRLSYRSNQWKKKKRNDERNIISHLLTCGMMIAGASAFAQFHTTFLYYLT